MVNNRGRERGREGRKEGGMEGWRDRRGKASIYVDRRGMGRDQGGGTRRTAMETDVSQQICGQILNSNHNHAWNAPIPTLRASSHSNVHTCPHIDRQVITGKAVHAAFLTYAFPSTQLNMHHLIIHKRSVPLATCLNYKGVAIL